MNNTWTSVVFCLLAIIAGFIVTYKIVPYLIKQAGKWSLLDKPGGRKKHAREIPVVGGIAISAGFMTGACIVALAFDHFPIPFFIYLVILLVTGVVDDRKGLPPALKWGGQVLAVLLIILSGWMLSSLHNIFGLTSLPYWLSISASIIFFTGTINAVNLMDGVDGLVGGICAINFFIFGVLFYLRGEPEHAVLACLLTACLLAFLLFNFAPARIFMGDAGALFLGGALVYFFIVIWNTSSNRVELYLAVSLISFPIFDMVRVSIYRLMNKRSPFSADRSHFHHYLGKTGARHGVVALLMYVFNLLLILQAIFLSKFQIEYFLVSNLLFFFLLFFTVRERASLYTNKIPV